jgi:hypothetical protein
MRILKIVPLAAALLAPAPAALATDYRTIPAARPEGWLVESVTDLGSVPPPPQAEGEIGEVKALVAKRNAADIERALWWDVGGAAYRWNEIAIEEMLREFITTLPATRKPHVDPYGHRRRCGGCLDREAGHQAPPAEPG